MAGLVGDRFHVDRPQVVAPITISHGINEFYAIVIPPIIPLLVTDLGITYGEAGLLMTTFFIMYALFQLPAGVIADWIGKRRLLVVGLIGMTIGIGFAGFATTYETLVIAQVIAGISGATFHPAGLSIISDVEVKGSEGTAMGIFAFGGTVGTLSAPIIVGGIGVLIDWRAALLTAAGIGGLATLAVASMIQRSSEEHKLMPDGGFIRGRIDALKDIARAVSTPEIGVLTVLTLVMSMQHRAIQTFTTAFVVDDLGVSVSTGNIAFFTLLAGGAIASLWAGELADRVNRISLGIAAALGTAVLVAATMLIGPAATIIPVTALVVFVLGWFAVLGFMMYASYPVKNALIAEESEVAHSGSIFGVIQTGSSIGSASGPALFGIVATQLNLSVAFAAIAAVSVVLAGCFGLLWLVRRG